MAPPFHPPSHRSIIPNSVSDYTMHTASPVASFAPPPSILKKNRLHSLDLAGSMTSSEISSGGSREDANEHKVRWSIYLFSMTSLASLLLSALCLQFHFKEEKRKTEKLIIGRKYHDALREASDAAEAAVLVVSVATFFFSSLQLFFALKMLKMHPKEPEVALKYIEKTSFLRLVIYSFWFLSIIVFLIVLLLSSALDGSTGVVARGIAVSLGLAAVLFCIVAAIRTVQLWTKTAYQPAEGQYRNLSTLV